MKIITDFFQARHADTTFAGQALREALAMFGLLVALVFACFFVMTAILGNSLGDFFDGNSLGACMYFASGALCIAASVSGSLSSACNAEQQPFRFFSAEILIGPFLQVDELRPPRSTEPTKSVWAICCQPCGLSGLPPSVSIRAIPRRPGAPFLAGL